MRNFLVTAAFAAFACTPVVQAVIITYCNEQKIREAVANSSATFGIGRRSKKAILCLTPGKAVTSSPAIPYSWQVRRMELAGCLLQVKGRLS